MRSVIAVFWVLYCMPMAVLAQSARQDTTINLPAGVSARRVSALGNQATISRTGALVASVCTDNVVRVWSARSAELMRTLNENAGAPRTVRFSADARMLAVAYQRGAVKVFDVESWNVTHDLTGTLHVHGLAFSPDSQRLAAVGAVAAQVWELNSGKSLAHVSPPFGGSFSVSFSPNGKWFATADGDAFVRVYDASSGNLQSTVQGFLLEPMAVAFSPDGKTLLAGGVDKTISMVESASGQTFRTIPKQPGLIWSLDVSTDGKEAAVVYRSAESFSDINHIILWDLVKGTVLVDFQKPGITITGGGFVGDHYHFAAASGNQLTLWSMP
jgi:WD40 repeat protein